MSGRGGDGRSTFLLERLVQDNILVHEVSFLLSLRMMIIIIFVVIIITIIKTDVDENDLFGDRRDIQE